MTASARAGAFARQKQWFERRQEVGGGGRGGGRGGRMAESQEEHAKPEEAR